MDFVTAVFALIISAITTPQRTWETVTDQVVASY